MKKTFSTLWLNNRFFYFLGGICLLFVLGFFFSLFFEIAKIALLILSVLTVLDVFLLYNIKKGITVHKIIPKRLSNNEENKITLDFSNAYSFLIHLNIIEEIPFQFQKRDFIFNIKIAPKKSKSFFYNLVPKERGEYHFGLINTYASTPLQLATKKYFLGEEKIVKCYPSFLKLQEFSFKALSNNTLTYGNNKTRKIGNSLEFEQIKEYVSGDDIRTLNWKATAKTGQLMVNQYVDEKSQSVYLAIDKGRTMQMSFDGLTLLDYAVNASLAISNVVLKKQDKVGMFTFSKKVEDLVVAERRNMQMTLISEALYNIKTDFTESDFSSLYSVVKRKITQRSLFVLFTNFETLDALNRQIMYLRALAKNHLVLVVFFKNTELNKLIDSKSNDVQKVYDSIIAEKFLFEKKQIVNELKKYGIQSVLTSPQELTGNAINKYLELKTKGTF
ncbi:DUF58 domain-containing protein [Polaribacter sp.]|nr:DUF58 domain-containing protein [Polaribacter sp.]